MPCENIVITIEETNEIIEIIINDFSVSNILSEDVGNTAVLGTDGKVFVPESGGVENHSELNLDDGTNPHGTTKLDVGLGNVDNTSDLNKPVSTAQQTALDLKENSVNKVTSIVGNETSNVFFATVKAVYDWAVGLFVPQTRTLTIGGVTQDLTLNRTFEQQYFNIVSNTTLSAIHNNSILRIKSDATVTIEAGMPPDFNFVVAIYDGVTYNQVAGSGVTQVPSIISVLGENMITTFVDGTNNYQSFGV